MIKTARLVPEVYYNKSRDFQLLGRTCDLVFNYLKNNIDTIYNLPLSKLSDKQLIDLMSMTLGFKPKHTYNSQQLFAVCSSLSEILRYKGTRKSLELVLGAIYNTEQIAGQPAIGYADKTIEVYCPSGITDLVLLNDLLDYILPAGIKYEIIKQTLLTQKASNNILPTNVISAKLVQQTYIDSTIPNYQADVRPADTGEGRLDNTAIVKYADTNADTNN